MTKKEQGTTTVEFAIVGTLFFIVIFGVIEFGRLLWTWSTLTEATRRGARVAVVCPVNHSAIARTTVFNDPGSGGNSPILIGLSPANVAVDYLDADGNPTGNFSSIRYVRVSIVNYQHQLLIPFVGRMLNAPAFETTLPRESLGVAREGAGPECFGTAA